MNIINAEAFSNITYGFYAMDQMTEKEKHYVMDDVYGMDRKTIISNHTQYDYEGSENFEHDDTGCWMNYSGVYDDVMSSFAEHENWTSGYDY